jgi:DNA-binding FrmR family transcriptional regulator
MRSVWRARPEAENRYMNDTLRQGAQPVSDGDHGIAIQSFYPDHKGQLTRLARIEGQIKGITRMIEERRYCVDIVSQIKAVQAALKQVQMGVLEKHIHHCVAGAANSGDAAQLNEKIEEIVQVVAKLD